MQAQLTSTPFLPYDQDNGGCEEYNEEGDVSDGVGGARVHGLLEAEVIGKVESNGTARIVQLEGIGSE